MLHEAIIQIRSQRKRPKFTPRFAGFLSLHQDNIVQRQMKSLIPECDPEIIFQIQLPLIPVMGLISENFDIDFDSQIQDKDKSQTQE